MTKLTPLISSLLYSLSAYPSSYFAKIPISGASISPSSLLDSTAGEVNLIVGSLLGLWSEVHPHDCHLHHPPGWGVTGKFTTTILSANVGWSRLPFARIWMAFIHSDGGGALQWHVYQYHQHLTTQRYQRIPWCHQSKEDHAQSILCQYLAHYHPRQRSGVEDLRTAR